MRYGEPKSESKHYDWSSRNLSNAGDSYLSVEPKGQHRNSLYSASSTALVFDPRRSSWQPFRPSSALSYSNLITHSANTPVAGDESNLDAEVESNSLDLDSVGNTILDQPRASSSLVTNNVNPRLSTTAPARIMTMDKFGPHTRNIAPKARIIKNVLVLGCSYMCAMGCFFPLRTYLSLASELKIVAPLALATVELTSAVSCFYGAAVARRLTYKMTIGLCQIPFLLLLGAVAYSHYYTIFPAAVLLGLCRGPLWNAAVAYLINMAAQFAYFSYETQDKMVKRFLSTFNTLAACGWTWGHLLSAGALDALEKSSKLESIRNATEPTPFMESKCGSRFCNKDDLLEFPVFHWSANVSSGTATLGSPHWKVLPVYATTVYAGNVICAVFLALFLLNKLKVQLCSQTSKQTSARQLFSEITQIFFHERMRVILPMFLFLGLQEAFVVCDVMKAYVLCITPKLTVGYVMFSYGLVNTFLNAFLCAAVRHIRRITILMAGLACQLGALVVMWMWKPVDNDQPILFVISTSWSMADSIWTTLSQTMVYRSFPDQWEAPFAVFYMIKAIGSAIGFLISPFGCMEYKIYFIALSSAAALIPFAIQELQAEKSEWFSSLSPSSSD